MRNYGGWKQVSFSLEGAKRFYDALYENLETSITMEELQKKTSMPEEALEFLVGTGVDGGYLINDADTVYVTRKGKEYYESITEEESES